MGPHSRTVWSPHLEEKKEEANAKASYNASRQRSTASRSNSNSSLTGKKTLCYLPALVILLRIYSHYAERE